MTLRNIAALMQHFRARRSAVAAANVLACSGLVGFIACSDAGVTEPAAPAEQAATLPALATLRLHASASASDTVTQSFVYTPATGTAVTIRGGAAMVTIPAAAVCDPQSSGYGTATWDRACVAARSPITFTIRTWVSRTGNAQAVVTPDVRFVPGKNAALYLPASTLNPVMRPVIQWCTAAMTDCVNESSTDPTLVTGYNPLQGVAGRRIKHFSGYNVGWSRGGIAPSAPLGGD